MQGWPATAAVALLLAGCGGGSVSADAPAAAGAGTVSDTGPTPSDLPSDSGMPPIETSGAASPAAGGSAGAVTAVTVNKSGSSPALAESWIVLQVVRHFPVPDRYPLLKDGELVAVKVKATGSSKYYSVISGSSFRLVGDGDDLGTDRSSIMGKDLAAAGYAPVLPDVHHGETKTGWLIFALQKPAAAKLTFRYTQLAATTPNGPIPAKNIDTQILG